MTKRDPRIFLVLLLVACAPAAPEGQPATDACNLLCLSARAREALAAGDHDSYLALSRQIAEAAPRHPGGHIAGARAWALMDQPDSALDALARLADLGAAFDIASLPVFAALADSPRFEALVERFERNGSPILSGTDAFELRDPDFLPEALAWDPAGRRWLVGSLAARRIIAVADGRESDYITDPRLLRVLGIHADSARDRLWFASWEPTSRPDSTSGTGRLIRTRLFRARLSTGEIQHVYEPRDTAVSHLFNDLAVAPDGTAYVTDTQSGAIWRVVPDVDSLESFVSPGPGLTGPNGIAITPDGTTLYVAFIEGIAVLDVATRSLTLLTPPHATSASGIDGLYWFRQQLIAVQNAPGLERVIRFRLNERGDAVVGSEVLERSRELMRVPTTGAIAGTRFYYIANSQADRLDLDNRLLPDTSPTQRRTVVRVIDLGPSNRSPLP